MEYKQIVRITVNTETGEIQPSPLYGNSKPIIITNGLAELRFTLVDNDGTPTAIAQSGDFYLGFSTDFNTIIAASYTAQFFKSAWDDAPNGKISAELDTNSVDTEIDTRQTTESYLTLWRRPLAGTWSMICWGKCVFKNVIGNL